ncbi:MAG: sel1 repeat family protein, partial [Proteobacteria bacterium]|nr:sel1 repeat family protein [Pseudomonadota bacterium]
MRKALSALVIALVLGWSGAVHAGDFRKGLEAYVAGDYVTAFREWRELAEQGLPRAQAGLGSMYQAGQGVAQDYAEAAKWTRLAAEQGHITAQAVVGAMYHEGQGVAQDYAEAVK